MGKQSCSVGPQERLVVQLYFYYNPVLRGTKARAWQPGQAVWDGLAGAREA